MHKNLISKSFVHQDKLQLNSDYLQNVLIPEFLIRITSAEKKLDLNEADLYLNPYDNVFI